MPLLRTSFIMQPVCSSSWSPSAGWLQQEPVQWGCPMAPLVQLLVQLGWETSMVTWSTHRNVPRHHRDHPQKLPLRCSWGCPEKDWMVRGERGQGKSSLIQPCCWGVWWDCGSNGEEAAMLSQVAQIQISFRSGHVAFCKCLLAVCPCAYGSTQVVCVQTGECKCIQTNSPNSIPTPQE